MSRRGKLDIINDILTASKDGAKKTQIMYIANLSFTQVKGYLSFLKKVKLIDEKDENNGTPIFRKTEKGSEFLKRYKVLKGLIE